MNRRCALLPISDPELQCKLLDRLVLPIHVLSYAREVWGVDMSGKYIYKSIADR